MPLMKIQGLEKRYTRSNVLQGVDMNIEPGRIIGLLGPNGSGKTTLMKVMAGLLQPDRGTLQYPGDASRGRKAKETISFLPDRMQFPGWMRVKDAFAYYSAVYPDFDVDRAAFMRDLLELREDMLIKRLSKGMQERVSLALVFSRVTSLYLLDEPLGGIDPVGKQKVLDSILSMDLAKASIIISTHQVKEVETVFDSFFLLSQGKIVFQGDCETIRQESGKTAEQIYLEVFMRANPM